METESQSLCIERSKLTREVLKRLINMKELKEWVSQLPSFGANPSHFQSLLLH